MQDIDWKILTHPNPELRHRSGEVDIREITTPEFQEFADAFAAFMVTSDGIGLAAPQIGLKKRIIAVAEQDRIGIFVNPEIIKKSEALQEFEEGCLSVPNVYGTVERSKRIRVRAIDRHGRKTEFDVSGFRATVFQHEIDHLDGVLFIDKVKKITRGQPDR
jgi:peptide deformylase